MSKEYIYATAANGIEVRIPKDKYPAWKATQDKIRAGEKVEPDPEIVKQLRSLMTGK
jgi:hypothetical protein